MLPAPTACPTRATRRRVRRQRRRAGQPGDRPGRRPVLLSASTTAPSTHPLLHRQPAADRRDPGEPDHRHAAADGELRRHRRRPTPTPAHAQPTPGTSTATGSSTTRRPRSRASPTRPPALHRQPARHRQRRPVRHRLDRRSTSATRAPTPVIDTPLSSLTWQVGQTINFTGHATDPEQGTWPPSALTWTLLLHHGTPRTATSTPFRRSPASPSGSFVAPDHEYPVVTWSWC